MVRLSIYKICLYILLSGLSLSGCSSCSKQADQETSGLELDSALPPRAKTMLTGSAFINKISRMSIKEREKEILKEILKGNVPAFMRELKPILLSGTNIAAKNKKKATIWVMPDYLAIGSDADYVRVPMNPITAQMIADRFGYSLPTRKLVNEIYKQAPIKLKPQPLPASQNMVSVAYFSKHNTLVNQQLGRVPNQIVAGHKKDVVLSNLLANHPSKVAIYGWHKSALSPIQPLSTVHGIRYVDYSHGIRLIKSRVLLDGNKVVDIKKAFADPNYYSLFSDEGPLRVTKISGGRTITQSFERPSYQKHVSAKN